MTTTPILIITQDKDGRFEACEEHATGTPIVGRGASVLEAVGDWCVNSGTVQITCEPFRLLKEYSIRNNWVALKFRRAPDRD